MPDAGLNALRKLLGLFYRFRTFIAHLYARDNIFRLGFVTLGLILLGLLIYGLEMVY